MSADRCDVCKRRYDFFTDGNGYVRASHSVGPCVPIVQMELLGHCANCQAPIYKKDRAGRTPKTCGKRICVLTRRNIYQRKARAFKRSKKQETNLRRFWQEKAA